MNDIETTFTITGAAVAVFAGLATVYFFKKSDEDVPEYEKLSKFGKEAQTRTNDFQTTLDTWLDENYPKGTGKNKRSRKHKRSKKHKK